MLNFPQNFNVNNNLMFPNNNINPNLIQSDMGFNNNNNNYNFNNHNVFTDQNLQNMPIFNIPNQNMNQINYNQNLDQINNNEVNSNNNLKEQIQKTNLEMNSNNFWININQIELIDSIIKFYHNSGNEYLDIKAKYQIMNIINRLNPNISLLKTNNDILDPLYYVKGQKKIIKFINSDFNVYNVKIPNFINKSDLYSIVEQYKSLNKTNILLIHKDSIIEKDESSIEFISEGDTVIIIENRNYKDDSFYNEIIKNNSNSNLINIRFIDDYHEKPIYSLSFPENITFSEMMKAFNLKLGFCENDNYYEHYMSIDGKITLKELFSFPSQNIHYWETHRLNAFNINQYGKIILIEAQIVSKPNDRTTIRLGLLNSNKLLIKRIEAELSVKVRNIYLNKNILNIKDEMSLFYIGIKENCKCMVDTN